jgi:outer membrane protein assembly factor BamB
LTRRSPAVNVTAVILTSGSRGRQCGVAIGVALLLCTSPTLLRGGADVEWSRFRGPNGSGSVETTGLPVEFGPERNLLWKTALPPGHSSPVLSGNRVYVTAVEGQALLTISLDATSGREVWRRTLPRRHSLPVDKRNDPASPTPVADGHRVYVFFQDFGLAAFDGEGRELWTAPLGPFNNAYGMGASPIIADGLVVLVCDQNIGSFMMAVDKETGRIRWRVERPESKTGHSTPIVYRPPNAPAQLLVPGSFALSAYALATGEKLWWVNGLAFEMKATPVMHDGLVYIHGTSSANFKDSYEGQVPSFAELKADHDKDADGRFSPEEIPDVLAKRWLKLMDLDGNGYLGPEEWAYYQSARSSQGGMWAFRLGGRGDMTRSSVVWHYGRSVPQLPSPLLYAGVLYMVNDGGIMTALDPKTGETLSQGRLRGGADSYYASPVAADGKVVVAGESGSVIVLKGDSSLTVLAVNELNDRIYATPAIADGRLYVRTRGALFCFGRQRRTN